MEFSELFRSKYRVALNAARANNKEATISGLVEIYKLFLEQYDKKNGEPIIVKAKLAYWKDVFNEYVNIINRNGLSDRRVQKLFGLIEDDSMPTLGDIIKAGSETVQPPAGADGVDNCGAEIDIDDDDIIPLPKKGGAQKKSLTDEEPVVGQTPVSGGEGGIKDERRVSYDQVRPDDPTCLDEFIGQTHVVKALKRELAIARQEGRKHLDNILLFGNPGLGKTTLMKLIARELGPDVRFELLDCAKFTIRNQNKALQAFLMRIAKENSPVVIAFDEIHLLSKELQSALLTLLNDRVYISPLNDKGECVRIPIKEFTFIGATTDDADVLDTIKNRCLRLKFQLVDYTPDELRQIYINKFAAKKLSITEEALALCIPRSRGAIRYVNAIVDGLDHETYDDTGRRVTTWIVGDLVKRYFKEKGIDPIGLEPKDLEILKVLEEVGGYISADTLSARVGMDVKKYMSEYERYLIQLGFIDKKSGKGRAITEKGLKHLHGEE